MGIRDRLRNKLKNALHGAPAEPQNQESPQTLKPETVAKPLPAPASTASTASTAQPTEKKADTPPLSPEPALPAEHRARADAPVRNAHLRPSFNTSEGSYSVQIIDERIGLNEHFPCEPGEFVLEAADRAGIELPYSCRSGGCLACTGKLVEGKTEMGEQFVLEESHLDEGFRLLCCTTVQSHAIFIANQEEEVD